MTTRSTESRSAPIAWPRPSVRGILNRLIASDAAYRQRLSLTAMDDRTLRDIGVTRADIAVELRRPILW